MAYAERDGTKLFFEETGEGPPILFLHEYGGDWRSWEPQVRHFSRDHRCITTCARGYPPSDVPADEALYGQDHAIADALAILGDEDDVCLDVNVWLKRAMPTAGLRVFPKSGHLINLEEPAAFNTEVADFLRAVYAGQWPVREAISGAYAGVGPVDDV